HRVRPAGATERIRRAAERLCPPAGHGSRAGHPRRGPGARAPRIDGPRAGCRLTSDHARVLAQPVGMDRARGGIRPVLPVGRFCLGPGGSPGLWHAGRGHRLRVRTERDPAGRRHRRARARRPRRQSRRGDPPCPHRSVAPRPARDPGPHAGDGLRRILDRWSLRGPPARGRRPPRAPRVKLLIALTNGLLTLWEQARGWRRRFGSAGPARGGGPAADGPVATVVLLNWQRPSNVRTILDAYTRYRRVAEIIVWNNNPDL